MKVEYTSVKIRSFVRNYSIYVSVPQKVYEVVLHYLVHRLGPTPVQSRILFLLLDKADQNHISYHSQVLQEKEKNH